MSRAPLLRTSTSVFGTVAPAALAVVAFAALTLPVLALSGCTASTIRVASAHAPAASSPSAPATTPPAPKPTVTTAAPPPPPPVVPANLPPTSGKGPAGSLKTTGTDSVALTFDDGPDPTYTPKILDMLKANGIHATFCLVGKQAKAYPALVRRIVAEGHTICDHTWAHSLDIGKQTREAILSDLLNTNAAIHDAAPNAKIQYFRAPGGNFTPLLVAVASEMGMHSLYWALDTRDWEYTKWGHGQSMVDHIITTVESKVRRGSIVLSHDYKKPDTITAYRTLLPWLKANVTLVPMPVT